jgi:hypothetical protein
LADAQRGVGRRPGLGGCDLEEAATGSANAADPLKRLAVLPKEFLAESARARGSARETTQELILFGQQCGRQIEMAREKRKKKISLWKYLFFLSGSGAYPPGAGREGRVESTPFARSIWDQNPIGSPLTPFSEPIYL